MEQESMISFIIEGTIILISLAAATITASIFFNYLLGIEIDPDTLTVFWVCCLMMLPGGYFMGKAVSQVFVINPLYEKDDSSQEETLKITEKSLLQIVEALKEESSKIKESTSTLEFTADKHRRYIYFFLSGCAFTTAFLWILSFLLGGLF